MKKELKIRESLPGDLGEVLNVQRSAFGSEEEAELVRNLLEDPSAEPILSLLALLENQPVGHIIFSRAVLDPPAVGERRILGPLAVIPSYQKKGIGGRLVERGLEILKEQGVDWVFVLGHETYYPRFGFSPAQKQGFQPPFPFPGEITNAWMAMSLTSTEPSTYWGVVIPSDTFNQHRYWGG